MRTTKSQCIKLLTLITTEEVINLKTVKKSKMCATVEERGTNLNQFSDIQLQPELSDEICHKSYKVMFLVSCCNTTRHLTSTPHSIHYTLTENTNYFIFLCKSRITV